MKHDTKTATFDRWLAGHPGLAVVRNQRKDDTFFARDTVTTEYYVSNPAKAYLHDGLQVFISRRISKPNPYGGRRSPSSETVMARYWPGRGKGWKGNGLATAGRWLGMLDL